MSSESGGRPQGAVPASQDDSKDGDHCRAIRPRQVWRSGGSTGFDSWWGQAPIPRRGARRRELTDASPSHWCLSPPSSVSKINTDILFKKRGGVSTDARGSLVVAEGNQQNGRETKVAAVEMVRTQRKHLRNGASPSSPVPPTSQHLQPGCGLGGRARGPSPSPSPAELQPGSRAIFNPS